MRRRAGRIVQARREGRAGGAGGEGPRVAREDWAVGDRAESLAQRVGTLSRATRKSLVRRGHRQASLSFAMLAARAVRLEPVLPCGGHGADAAHRRTLYGASVLPESADFESVHPEQPLWPTYRLRTVNASFATVRDRTPTDLAPIVRSHPTNRCPEMLDSQDLDVQFG